MTKLLGIIACLFVLVAAGTASAAGEFPQGTAAPFVYDPDGTGIIVSEWNDLGNILIQQKNGPTSANAAAGAELVDAAGSIFTDASFEVKGYCNNGSPRLNLFYGDAVAFLGCARALDTSATEDGWTRVAFVCDSEVGLPDEAAGACGQVIDLAMFIQDEEGQTDIRNIVVNGLPYGPPQDVPSETVGGQENRGGYCMPTAVLRADGTMGRFVDLFIGQPGFDARYRQATPAYFLQGAGLSCELPKGYFLNGSTVDGLYPFAAKA
jgi:hypothetical protein